MIECKGKKGHKLCASCEKFNPKSENPNRFLSAPCKDLKTCTYFVKKNAVL